MNEKQIELLQQQIEKLGHKNFDLTAWKTQTAILLARIFGEDSQKIKLIEKLDYEYNSWSLRDTSGHSAYLDSCKKLGREILEASVNEIEVLGTPESHAEKTGKMDIGVVLDALNDELKGAQYKSLLKTLKSEMSNDEKQRLVQEIIREIGEESTRTILVSVLLNSTFVAGLSAD
jgi:single-stranded DNA-specific DHH superfamily exonuclease